jgi:hypothetical protein
MMSKCSFCDPDDGYLCFYCEEFLKDAVKDAMKLHKTEILDTCDWWWGLTDYSINVFCNEEGGNQDEPDALFQINIYKVGENGMDDYSMQYDLDPMTRKEIRLL